jgi:hypothetical protein
MSPLVHQRRFAAFLLHINTSQSTSLHSVLGAPETGVDVDVVSLFSHA